MSVKPTYEELERYGRQADIAIENLQMKLEKMAAEHAGLAAELQSVKAMNDCLSEELRGYESDGAFEGPKMHLLWWQCETPNHDAFLAEVRAQGVEMLARETEKLEWHESTVRFVLKFAAQLRKERE